MSSDYYPEIYEESAGVKTPPEIAPVVETPTNEYSGGEYGLLGADDTQYSKSIAKGAGVDLNSVASGVGDVASGVADITSSIASGAIDIASSIVSGAVSVAADVASGAVQLTVRAATASKTGDLNKYSKSDTYGYEGFYPEDGSNPIPNETGTDLNGNDTSNNAGFTNEEIRGSLDGSVGEDLNRYSKDAGTERLNTALENFQDGKWSNLSLDERKHSMTELADYVADATGNKNPPEIVFRDNMNDGEYGGYNPNTNTLEINQNMLDDPAEAADTVAHEMWHAYQQQCALDPASERGREYQEGFDNYISPAYDFEGYQNQMVEAEAREFAQGFKDRLSRMQGV